MDLSISLKSFLATLTTKTTLASTDGMMTITTANGTPNGKIGLSGLVQGLSLYLLPIKSLAFSQNKDTITDYGIYVLTSSDQDFGAGSWLFNFPHPTIASYGLQIVFARASSSIINAREKRSGVWGAWKQVSFDVPAFYNSYADLAALTSAVYKGQWYGDCTTAADTAAKTCTISGFLAVPTSVVTVHFTEAISVNNATLNISSTGAKPILFKGVALQSGVVPSNSVVTMQYDGTGYNITTIQQ